MFVASPYPSRQNSSASLPKWGGKVSTIWQKHCRLANCWNQQHFWTTYNRWCNRRLKPVFHGSPLKTKIPTLISYPRQLPYLKLKAIQICFWDTQSVFEFFLFLLKWNLSFLATECCRLNETKRSLFPWRQRESVSCGVLSVVGETISVLTMKDKTFRHI